MCTPDWHMEMVIAYQEHFAIQQTKRCKKCGNVVRGIKLQSKKGVTLWLVG